MKIQTRFTRTFAAAAAAALTGALAFTAGLPANAVILSEVDRPKIKATGYDFGTDWDTFSAPRDGGYVYWDLTNGVTTPDIQGNLYQKNSSGNCSKLKVEYLDGSSSIMTTKYSAQLCASNDNLVYKWVRMNSYGAVGLTYVRIKLISTPNGGATWYLQGEQTWSVA